MFSIYKYLKGLNMENLLNPVVIIKALLYYIRSGGFLFLSLFLVAQYIYFGIKVLKELANRFGFNQKSPQPIFRTFIWFFIGFNLTSLLFFTLMGISIQAISNHAKSVDVNLINHLYMQADHFIFGRYVPFWFQSIENPIHSLFDFYSPLIIFVFKSLGVVIGLSLVYIISRSSRRFYQLAIALALTMIIGIPIWYSFPALSPMQGYLDNLMNVEIPKNIQQSLANYRPNPALESFLDEVRLAQGGEDSRVLLYTTMPSMHVAWSVVIFYYVSLISIPLGVVLSAYLFLNILATVFTLQHYAIDPPAGILVAILAILITSLITQDRTPKILSNLTLIIKDDIKNLKQKLKTTLKFKQ